MLSHKLIEMIEGHWEQITARVICDIQTDSRLEHVAGLPASELQEWSRGILKNLGHYLAGEDEELARRYEALGRLRFSEGVPLHEAVRGLHLLKDRLVDFVRNYGFAHSTLEIYAEEELEHRTGLFFDWLVWHLVRGYEAALRSAGRLDKAGNGKPADHRKKHAVAG